MPNSIGERFQHAWNAFFNKDPTRYPTYIDYGYSSSYRPDRLRLTRGSERTIVSTIYNQIAIDVASIDISHVRVDVNGRFIDTIHSGLNNALTVEANIDQTGRALIQDIVMSMFDEGCVAVVPTDTTLNPERTGSYDILSLRTGKIVEWFPKHVKVEVYNENSGKKEEVVLMKQMVAIIENPLYAVMNEPNSTLQRLVRTINKLDAVNEQNASGKLDLIIQLPYIIKTQARQDQAEMRRKSIEAQLINSKYGIAYTDGTERITQLNRPVENNLWAQVKDLTSMLYNQLGLTETIFDGTADEKTMINYYSRTIEPILRAITEEMTRTFLTKTARTQGQSIKYFRKPFQLVPLSELAEIADKFTRNEIATSNEIRAEIGWKPANDPSADELRNKNLYDESTEVPQEEADVPFDAENAEELDEEAIANEAVTDESEADFKTMNSDLDDIDQKIAKLEGLLDDDSLKHYASPYYDPVKAHEYYMKHRELVGRKSTSTLNEEGKSTANYVKSQIDEERKAKIKAHKDSMDSQIKKNNESSRARIKSNSSSTNARIKANTSNVQRQVESNTSATNARISQNSELTSTRIKQNTSNTNTAIKQNSEALKAELKRRKESVKSSIESHKSNMQNKIDSLNARLKGMTKSQRKANQESIRAEIAKLRAENSAKREQLNSAYSAEAEGLRAKNQVANQSLREKNSSTNTELRSKNSAESKSLRESNSSTNKALREKNSAVSSSLREKNKKANESIRVDNTLANAKLREEHKDYVNKLAEEYENKYLDELDKIKAEGAWQAEEKTKSSSSGSSGKSSSSSRSSSSSKKSSSKKSSESSLVAAAKKRLAAKGLI